MPIKDTETVLKIMLNETKASYKLKKKKTGNRLKS